VLLAYRLALASPRIRAAAIEASEFRADADAMEVTAVPTIVVNGAPQWAGSVPERAFLERVIAATFE